MVWRYTYTSYKEVMHSCRAVYIWKDLVFGEATFYWNAGISTVSVLLYTTGSMFGGGRTCVVYIMFYED